MASGTVNVSGLAELEAALDRAGEHVRAALVDAVAVEVRAVVRDARARVRYDTGDLHDSIGGEFADGGLSAEVGPQSSRSRAPADRHAQKAQVNEFGRSSMPAQPYMGPAAERSRHRWPRRAADAVKAAVK